MSQRSTNPARISNLEQDAVKQQRAIELIQKHLEGEVNFYDLDDDFLNEIGATALKNQFIFAFEKTDDNDSGFYVYAASKLHWDKYKEAEDRTDFIGNLLPCSEVAEMVWEFDDKTSVKQAVLILHKAGFQFDETFQNATDASLTAEIKAVYNPTPKRDFDQKAPRKNTPPHNDNRGPGKFGGGFGA